MFIMYVWFCNCQVYTFDTFDEDNGDNQVMVLVTQYVR